jgi:peptidyl-prolyl cis-trans isomerase D
MLKQLRSQKTMKRIMKITLILIIPSFIAFFGWSSLNDSPGGGSWYFIKIKESPFQIFRWSKIGDREMKEAQANLIMEYQGLLGLNPQMADQAQKLITPSALATRALDNHILFNVAKKKGLFATQQEFISFVEKIYPQDPKRAFAYIMRAQGYTDENQFLRDQVYRMTLDKSRSVFAIHAKASLFELWHQYLLMEEKVRVAYLTFQAKDFTDKVQLSEEDVKKYYEENKETYQLPNQVQYEYLAVNKNAFIEDSPATDTEIQAYYEEHRDTEFKVERQVKMRQIMLSLPPDATEDTTKQIEDFMSDLYTSLTVSKADFAELADRFSDDPANIQEEADDQGKPTGKQIKNGGLLPRYWSLKEAERSRYGKTVIEEALKMDGGQISRPIKGDLGFHILKIEEIRPESIIPYEDARQQAEFGVKRNKGDKLFEEKKKILYEKYEQTSTLAGLAKEVGTPFSETKLVPEETIFFPEFGSLAKFRETLMSLRQNEISDVLETPSLLAVLQIKKRVPSYIPSLEEIKEKADEDARLAQGLILAKKAAESLFKEASSLEMLKQKAEENKYKLETPEPFTYSTPPPELANIKRFAQITLKTKDGTMKVSELTGRSEGRESPTGYVVWYLIEKIPPDRAQFKKDLPKIQRDYIQGKQKILVQENLKDLTRDLRFEVNPRFLGIE